MSTKFSQHMIQKKAPSICKPPPKPPLPPPWIPAKTLQCNLEMEQPGWEHYYHVIAILRQYYAIPGEVYKFLLEDWRNDWRLWLQVILFTTTYPTKFNIQFIISPYGVPWGSSWGWFNQFPIEQLPFDTGLFRKDLMPYGEGHYMKLKVADWVIPGPFVNIDGKLM